MSPQNIEILEQMRPRVELFFRTGSLVLPGGLGGPLCEKCIDTVALIQVMRQEFEPGADLNPHAEWDDETGYKGFLSRLYAHYDRWKAEQVEQKKLAETSLQYNSSTSE